MITDSSAIVALRSVESRYYVCTENSAPAFREMRIRYLTNRLGPCFYIATIMVPIASYAPRSVGRRRSLAKTIVLVLFIVASRNSNKANRLTLSISITVTFWDFILFPFSFEGETNSVYRKNYIHNSMVLIERPLAVQLFLPYWTRPSKECGK